MEGQQQTISGLKEVPDKAIQFQHICTCLRNSIFIYHTKRKYQSP